MPDCHGARLNPRHSRWKMARLGYTLPSFTQRRWRSAQLLVQSDAHGRPHPNSPPTAPTRTRPTSRCHAALRYLDQVGLGYSARPDFAPASVAKSSGSTSLMPRHYLSTHFSSSEATSVGLHAAAISTWLLASSHADRRGQTQSVVVENDGHDPARPTSLRSGRNRGQAEPGRFQGTSTGLDAEVPAASPEFLSGRKALWTLR